MNDMNEIDREENRDFSCVLDVSSVLASSLCNDCFNVGLSERPRVRDIFEYMNSGSSPDPLSLTVSGQTGCSHIG